MGGGGGGREGGGLSVPQMDMNHVLLFLYITNDYTQPRNVARMEDVVWLSVAAYNHMKGVWGRETSCGGWK